MSRVTSVMFLPVNFVFNESKNYELHTKGQLQALGVYIN